MPGLTLNPQQQTDEPISFPASTPDQAPAQGAPQGAPQPVGQPGQPGQPGDANAPITIGGLPVGAGSNIIAASQKEQQETYSVNSQVVNAFNTFIGQGGDLNKLTSQQLSDVVDSAKGMPPIDHPEQNPAMFYAEYHSGKYGIPGPLEIGENVVKGAFNMARLAVVQGSKSLFDWWANTAGPTGMGPGLSIGPSLNDYTDYQAKGASATVQGARQDWDFYTSQLPHGIFDIVNSATISLQKLAQSNPDKVAQLDVQQSEILRQNALRDAQYQKNLTDTRDATADLYKKIGMDDYATRILKAAPSQDEIGLAGMVMDPSTWLGFASEAISENVFKVGIRSTRLAESTAHLTELEGRMSQTALERTQIQGVLDGSTTISNEERASYQTAVARLKTLEQKLSDDHKLATGEYQAAVTDVGAQYDKAAKANPIRGATGTLVQAGGQATQLVGKASEFISKVPEAIVDKMMPTADEATKAAAADGVRKWGGALGHVAASAVGFGLGGPVGAAIGPAGVALAGKIGEAIANPAMLKQFGRDFATVGEQYAMGQQTLPFWRNIAERTTGLTSFAASTLDNKLIYGIPKVASGAFHGGVISGGLGYLASGGNVAAAAQGFGGGGFIGGAGAGLGQLKNFNNLADLRGAAIGDRSRFLSSISPDSAKLFTKLHPEVQLSTSVYAMAHPDVDFHFFSDPTKAQGNGWWEPNNPRGSIFVNVDGDNPVHAITAHEIAHHIAGHGLGQTVADYQLGNPITGQIGVTTALDADGKPMIEYDPVTNQPRYVQTPEFEKVKADYNARKIRDNPKAAPEDNYGIAQEMFADMHADYLHDPENLQKMVRGHVPSDLFSENAVNNYLSKLGMGGDPTTGNPIPTGALEGAKGLVDLVNNYYKQRKWKQSTIEGDRGDTRVEVGDVVKGTPAFDRVSKNLDSTGDIVRNPDGSIKTGLDGRPIVKTPRQADLDHAELGQFVQDIYKRQPHLEGAPGDNLLKRVTDRDGREFLRGQVVPQEVMDQIIGSNRFNANQINNWMKMNGIMSRNDGTMTHGIYNTASTSKGRYATLPSRSRVLVPLETEISLKTNQVNMKSYDPSQLQANAVKMLKTKAGKEIYNGNISPALDDIRTYMNNLANGRPGETGIGLQKKGIINTLFGFNTDANPTMAGIKNRNPSVIKSFRIDRMNQIHEIPGTHEPFHAETYENVRGFKQPSFEPGPEARFQPSRNPSDKAWKAAGDVPKGERSPEQHDILAARTMHEWNTQKDTVPLVARRGDDGHVITDKDGNIQYKTQDFGLLDAPVVQGLIKKYGKEEGFQRATDLLSNRLAEQYKKWEADPDLHPAIGWYSGMRDRLQASFGATIDKFANMLAATSAQEGVKTNFNYTIEALRKMSKGDYDELMTNFREYAQQATDRIMGDDSIKNKEEVLRKEINKFGSPRGGDIGDVPLKDNGKKYGINSQKVLHALTDYWVDQAGGPKTSNFGENLSWRSIDPTVDVWASRTARRLLYEGDVKRWRLHPAAEGGVGDRTKGGHDDYTLAESGYRGAAGQVGMNPDDTQAFMWFGEKKHYADRGWTVGTGATLGDFRNIMDQMQYQRYQAGLTTDRGPETRDPAKLEAARGEMEKSIQGLGNGVVAQRVTTSRGLYGGATEEIPGVAQKPTGYDEPSLDVEFTTKHGTDVSSIENKVKEIAKRNDQDAAFLSEIHEDKRAGSRPIAEMGFNKPATDTEIQRWAKAFEDYKLGGFTIAKDSRGKALGIRSQAIPEFIGVDPSEHSQYMESWLERLNSLKNDPSLPWHNITYNKSRYASTKIFRKGEHY